MSVTLGKDIAIDLIQLKLSSIRSTISEIMEDWDVKAPERFVEMARSGELEEAEMDAITIRQLIHDLDKYESLLMEIRETR